MANKTLFSNSVKRRTPKTNTVNAAGGKAYSTTSEYQLAQYVVTGTFNGTYYVSGQKHLEDIKALAQEVSPEFLAKVAVYGHQKGRMKDLPAFCLAVLAARGELAYLKMAWPKVITNVKMLLNFVQIIRSGVLGRKSFGSAVKRLIQEWIVSKNGKQLMMARIGHSKPSLEDVIKMVHPRPQDELQDAMFAYMIGKPYNAEALPSIVKEFEAFKKDNTLSVPDLPFRALTNCGLTDTHWKEMGENMPWNTLRMNINLLARHGVFKDDALTRRLAKKIADPEEVMKWNAFPYQLLTTYMNVTDDIPQVITLALQDAMEVATSNAPDLGRVCICPDLSGSMTQAVMGGNKYMPNRPQSKTTCKHVAALMAAVAIRQNPEAKVIAWADQVKEIKLNPRDSVMTNAQALAKVSVGYGTNASLAVNHINKMGWKGDGIVYLSDFQTWMDPVVGVCSSRYNNGTGMAQGWEVFKKNNKDAKLIGIDLASDDATVQVGDSPNVLNIPGFSDAVFDVIGRFVHEDNSHFVKVVNEVQL